MHTIKRETGHLQFSFSSARQLNIGLCASLSEKCRMSCNIIITNKCIIFMKKKTHIILFVNKINLREDSLNPGKIRVKSI